MVHPPCFERPISTFSSLITYRKRGRNIVFGTEDVGSRVNRFVSLSIDITDLPIIESDAAYLKLVMRDKVVTTN